MPRIVALIPARGGSKGVPRKNLHMLAGKPLIARSVAAALEATLLDGAFVSTEDPEIAMVARWLQVHPASVLDKRWPPGVRPVKQERRRENVKRDEWSISAVLTETRNRTSGATSETSARVSGQ